MHCTFYRPATVNTTEFENVIGKLSYDLHLLENHKHDEWSIYSYVYALCGHAKSLKNNPAMRFLGVADPEVMPSDARVDFFYRPTYIATAFMIQAVLMYPSLMDISTFLDSELDFDVDTVKEILSACMLACTGRSFDSAGVLHLKDCIKLFQDAGTDDFLKKYPGMCPEFADLYHKKKALVESGMTDPHEAWYNHINPIADEPEYVWYACYGSNVNRNRFMAYINRCSDNTPPVEDRPYIFKHDIYFAKSAAGWDNGGKAFLDDTKQGSAYGRIYKITMEQYEEVKCMEGGDYTKQLSFGTVSGLPVYSFTDTQKNSPEKFPSKKYFSTILDGLRDCYEGLADRVELANYLISKIMPKQVFSVVRAIKENTHYLSNEEIHIRTGLALSDVTAATEWLVAHNVINQDRRSIRAGHQVRDPEAFFFTVEGPCARDLVGAMIVAVV